MGDLHALFDSIDREGSHVYAPQRIMPVVPPLVEKQQTIQESCEYSLFEIELPPPAAPSHFHPYPIQPVDGHQAPRKDMDVLRGLYETITPPTASWIAIEPETPAELATVSISCLQKMLPLYQTKMKDAQMVAEHQERLALAAHADEERYKKETDFINKYIQFLQTNT